MSETIPLKFNVALYRLFTLKNKWSCIYNTDYNYPHYLLRKLNFLNSDLTKKAKNTALTILSLHFKLKYLFREKYLNKIYGYIRETIK